jgi:uncharacterized membrane protein YccC
MASRTRSAKRLLSGLAVVIVGLTGCAFSVALHEEWQWLFFVGLGLTLAGALLALFAQIDRRMGRHW